MGEAIVLLYQAQHKPTHAHTHTHYNPCAYIHFFLILSGTIIPSTETDKTRFFFNGVDVVVFIYIYFKLNLK